MDLLETIAAQADRVGAGWFSAKTALEHSLAFADDALHVIIGVVLQLVAAILLRVPISRWAPWLLVLGLELVNEVSDLRVELWPEQQRSAQFGEGLKDVLLTMTLPTLLLVATRWCPAAFAKR